MYARLPVANSCRHALLVQTPFLGSAIDKYPVSWSPCSRPRLPALQHQSAETRAGHGRLSSELNALLLKTNPSLIQPLQWLLPVHRVSLDTQGPCDLAQPTFHCTPSTPALQGRFRQLLAASLWPPLLLRALRHPHCSVMIGFSEGSG